MPEVHLRQPGFSACGPFTKNKKKNKKFKKKTRRFKIYLSKRTR